MEEGGVVASQERTQGSSVSIDAGYESHARVTSSKIRVSSRVIEKLAGSVPLSSERSKWNVKGHTLSVQKVVGGLNLKIWFLFYPSTMAYSLAGLAVKLICLAQLLFLAFSSEPPLGMYFNSPTLKLSPEAFMSPL